MNKKFFTKKKLTDILIKILDARTSLKFLGLLIFVLLIYCFSNLSYWIESAQVKASDSKEFQNQTPELVKGEEIPISNDNYFVTSNNKYELYLNTNTTNVRIVDKQTGKVWNTMVENDTTLLGTEANLSKSNLILQYETLTKTEETLNSYEHSVVNKDYTLEKLTNGLRINYVLSKSEITLSYFPAQISVERMQEKILSNPDLTERDLTVINRVFSLAANKEYYLRAASAQTNVRKELYRIFYDKCGYTEVDLTMDNEMYGYETNVQALPQFEISLELILYPDRLHLNIPTYAIDNADSYTITDILVLPYFGAVRNAIGSEASDKGYLFVPDGSGALIEFNSFRNNDYVYLKQIYDNDMLFNSGFALNPSYTTEITMPVFGSINQSQNQGLMGVVVSGEEVSKIYAYSSGYMNYKYNCVMSTFCHNIYDDVGLYNFYDSNTVRIYAAKALKFDYQIDYYFLTNETNSYAGMAKLYQNYLIEQYELEKNYNNQPQVVLEFLGGITIDSNIVGIPVKKEIALTSFKEAFTILESLRAKNVDSIKAVYTGWFNRGINQSLASDVKILKTLQKDLSFEAFNQLLQDKNYDLSFATNLYKVFNDKENGFKNNQKGVRLMDNDTYAFYNYSLTSGQMTKNEDHAFYYLSPKYFISIAKKVNDFYQTKRLEAITLNDIGNYFSADFNRKDFIDPLTSRNMIIQTLEKLSNVQTTNLRNPFPYTLPYADYLYDVVYESSNYYLFSMTVPFLQLVYNGLINYSTENINNGTIDFNDRAYMKALETGADLKYLVSFQDTNLLKETSYNYYYSAKFSNWETDMVTYYQKYLNDFRLIQSRTILNHEMLAQNVFLVSYETGAKVVFNYSDSDFLYLGESISGQNYRIVEEGN